MNCFGCDTPLIPSREYRSQGPRRTSRPTGLFVARCPRCGLTMRTTQSIAVAKRNRRRVVV